MEVDVSWCSLSGRASTEHPHDGLNQFMALKSGRVFSSTRKKILKLVYYVLLVTYIFRAFA